MEEMNEMDSQPWKRPDEVMRMHRLKLKKKALHARITRSDQSNGSYNSEQKEIKSFIGSLEGSNGEKRKNPFKCEPVKRFKSDNDVDINSESSLFHHLSERKPHFGNLSISENSFHTIFQDHNDSTLVLPNQQTQKPVDWSLKTKMRLLSPKPYPWSQKLRTCEEASGITGYVRCLDTSSSQEVESNSCSLDTSPNARFHQCTLFWQHPYLPWLPLFPRMRGEGSSGVNAGIPPFALDSAVKDSLHHEWCESFRSLFQLVRARQCPYFYVCANSFTCLFRAAGVAGISEMHALLTPTTRGLRAALKEEDVVFSMPLKKNPDGKPGRTSDEGYETLNSTMEDGGVGKTGKISLSPSIDKKKMTLKDIKTELQMELDEIGGEEDDDEEEDEEASEWLEKMGVNEAEIKRMESEQAKHVVDRERDLDRKPESLVYVEGVEAQALFNFLMDCRSCVAPTGPLAGIPPTLLAPVSFRGATLAALKVRHSEVKVEGKSYHSVELRGPILPSTIHSILSLLCSSPSSNPTFSATFAGVESTKAFSVASPKPQSSSTETGSDASAASSAYVFQKESLIDCGLVSSTLEAFCHASNSFNLDNLKFSDSMFSWSASS